MRTIKFRAFDDGKMIYENDILHIRNEDNLVLRLARFWSNIRNDCQIMQFTGLLDKNSREIYEGDVVRCTSFKNLGFSELDWDADKTLFSIDELKGKKEDEYICEIIFEDGEFITEVEKNGTIIPLACFFGEQRNSQPMFFIEIIGNIHEKPRIT